MTAMFLFYIQQNTVSTKVRYKVLLVSMEAKQSYKILVNIYQTIWNHNQENRISILTKAAYFSSIFININFQDSTLSSPPVEVCTAAMLVLLMVGNKKV
jgi:hypothetical protein